MTQLIRLLAVAIGLLVSAAAHATAQIPDVLLLDGEQLILTTNPLEPYLVLNPDKRPAKELWSSALWRGYIATWEISANFLTLKKLKIEHSSDDEDSSLDVTEKYFPGAPLRATWYTGTLIIPRGKLVDYVHMGYGSTYERYILLSIRGGRLEKRLDLSLDQFNDFRRKNFQEFKETSTYKHQFEDSVKKIKDEGRAEYFLYQFYAEQYLSATSDHDSEHDEPGK